MKTENPPKRLMVEGPLKTFNKNELKQLKYFLRVYASYASPRSKHPLCRDREVYNLLTECVRNVMLTTLPKGK